MLCCELKLIGGALPTGTVRVPGTRVRGDALLTVEPTFPPEGGRFSRVHSRLLSETVAIVARFDHKQISSTATAQCSQEYKRLLDSRFNTHAMLLFSGVSVTAASSLSLVSCRQGVFRPPRRSIFKFGGYGQPCCATCPTTVGKRTRTGWVSPAAAHTVWRPRSGRVH